MGRKTENTDFNCISCGEFVSAIKKGTIRNHCPFCLRSVHVDDLPGDRANGCHGVMHPVRVVSHSAKGWQILHRCEKCGREQPNRLADDDNTDIVAEIMRNSALG
ncbi:MAG: RNHCP domain-containing protein [Defluviitaleaceae bacterium]|nr:RNHCP domain-containing protein [Defluviitaleaceae bacterium]